MWDQHKPSFSNIILPRIIPTYVGSTYSSVLIGFRASNHSHVCGINSRKRSRGIRQSESFPRMWDQQHKSRLHHLSVRIIPTYVGSTPRVPKKIASKPNHSHVCGINHLQVWKLSLLLESFPRMWDQPTAITTIATDARIIPTYVGSTFCRRPSGVSEANHSHVCGINQGRGAWHLHCFESFPRMWDQHLKLF